MQFEFSSKLCELRERKVEKRWMMKGDQRR